MYRPEPRDASGPMDIDDHDPMSRLEQFVLPTNEGPSRKRPHADVSTPSRPFNPTPAKTYHIGTDLPFLFHSVNAPPMPPTRPWEPYDPNKFGPINFDIGSQTPVRAVFEEDVEMRDSPARPEASGEAGPSRRADEAVASATEAAGAKENERGGQNRESESVDTLARPMAHGAVTRELRKRQRRKSNLRRPRVDTDDEDERALGGKREQTHNYNFHTHSPTLRHSEIPSLLIGYIQVFVNVAIVVFVLYLAVQFVLTVRRDVKDRMAEVSVEILQEIAECTKLYLTNRCDPALRVPAMEAPCKAWEACMARDPTVVGRTNVMAETFAGVINSFVDPISWKTMGFTLTTLCFLIILTNSALWNLKSKVEHVPPPSSAPFPQHYLTHGAFMPPHAINPAFPLGQPGQLGLPPSFQPSDGQGQGTPQQIEYPKSKWKIW